MFISELLAPALVEADCEPFRADNQTSAGDIRTDMFFELVTADVVVADLSILNPNVYYELGIRDGVCPRGVFIIDGGWSAPEAFRCRAGSLLQIRWQVVFARCGARQPDQEPSQRDHGGDQGLGAVLARALQSDGSGNRQPSCTGTCQASDRSIGMVSKSPKRAISERCSGIGNSASARRGKWTDQVTLLLSRRMRRRAFIGRRSFGKPRALLIGLCEFHAAEDVLQEILRITPDDIDSQLYLGIVLAICRDTERAEHQLRSMLARQETDPKAGAALGYVYRLLWYLQWKDAQNPRERARESIQLLVSSICSFLDVHRLHPEEYFSGYNALLLLEVATELFPDCGLPERFVNRGELATVVRYTANAARENAGKTGDYDTQFWSAVALSGLEMLANNDQEAAQRIEDACAVPSATRFFLQLLKERLDLLRLLKFREKFVIDALKTVDRALRSKQQQKRWARVFVFHGYPIDEKDQVGRFPSSAAKAVENRIRSILEEWKVGAGDLAICSGSTESDVMFGERCLELNANVRLLMLEPTPLQLVKPFIDPTCNEWISRCSALLDHPETEVWYHTDELGDPVEPATAQSRHNRWILNTARMEAENADEEDGPT